MLKKFSFLLFLIFVKSGLFAIELPAYFCLDTPKFYMVGDDIIDIKADDQSLGLIKRNITGSIWSKRIPTYELYSAENGFEAVAKVEPSEESNKAIFSICNEQGNLIGRVLENWEKSSGYHPTFEIYQLDLEPLAIGKWDASGFIFTLMDPIDKHSLVSFVAQERFFLGNWTVLVKDPKFLDKINPSLLILSLAIASNCTFHYKLCGQK